MESRKLILCPLIINVMKDPRVEALMKMHPFLDFMMAETLLLLSDRGMLEDVVARAEWPDCRAPSQHIVREGITVEREKICPVITNDNGARDPLADDVYRERVGE